MPAKNRIKDYEANSWYHIYNRGVEKQNIFRDEQDYAVFLSYLKTYLEPKDELGLQSILANPVSSSKEKDVALKELRLNNFHDELDLAAYCLMPNHFHLLVYQKNPDTIDRFFNSLGTRFTMFINKKNKRVGGLFQDVYKAVMVQTDEQLLYLTRYIHRNPLSLHRVRKPASQGQALRSWKFGSYMDYLGLRNTKWLKNAEIIKHFSRSGFNSYQNFVEDTTHEEKGIFVLENINIDDQ